MYRESPHLVQPGVFNLTQQPPSHGLSSHLAQLFRPDLFFKKDTLHMSPTALLAAAGTQGISEPKKTVVFLSSLSSLLALSHHPLGPMAPPVEAFPAQELAARVQYDARGKYRKGGIELERCKLLEMVQYACEVENRNDPRGRVMCRPLVRLFRR